MAKLILVDAHNYLHRAYHALPPLTTPDGETIHAVYGFARTLFKLLKEYKPDYCAVCFDSPQPSFRKAIYGEYKANRKETEESLKSQFPRCRELISAMDLPIFELGGVEADDIIATIATKAESHGIDVTIVSADKDLLQLVRGNVKVLNDSKGALYDANGVYQLWGVQPSQIQDLLSLMGDSSDNIPGIPGVGEKTAKKLIQEYQTISNLIQNLDRLPEKIKQNLKNNLEQLKRNQELIQLKNDVPLNFEWKHLALHQFNNNHLLPLLKKWGFQTLIKDLTLKGFLAANDASVPIGNYQIILTEEDLKEALQSLSRCKEIAFTFIYSHFNNFKSPLVGLGISGNVGGIYTIPFHTTLNEKQIIEILKPLFENKTVKKYSYNLKRQVPFLYSHGISIDDTFMDSQIAAHLLNPTENNFRFKNIVWKYLGEEGTDMEDLYDLPAVKDKGLDVLGNEAFALNTAKEVTQLFRLSQKLQPLIEEQGFSSLLRDIDMPLVPVLSEMELEGIQCDILYLEEIGSRFCEEINDLELKAYELAGQEFNLNSSKQLSFILFEKLQLPPSRKTKTHYSTDEGVLNLLSEVHALPKIILKHRELSKLQSTYIDGLGSFIAADGRIHTHLNQTGTATGRLSSNDPNLQNIPIRSDYGKMIRRAFIPKTGTLFLAGDYSQIDLRVLAHLSQDKILMEAFIKGEDIHRATAAEIYGIPPEQVSSEQRSRAKAINFGIIYGQQAFGLAGALKISVPEAQKMIDDYFSKYTGIKRWINETIRQAQANGAVKTLLGHIRYIPEIRSKNGALKAFGERTAMNSPVQGTSADVIKCAMIKIHRELTQVTTKLKPNLLLQVHDDLLFEVPEDQIQYWGKRIKELMENAFVLSIPLIADIKVGKNWADMAPLTE